MPRRRMARLTFTIMRMTTIAATIAIIITVTTMATIMVTATATTGIPMLMATPTITTTDAVPEPAAPDGAAMLYRLLTWLSPSFPIGAFSYSSGIEWAVEAGDITDAASLRDWLATLLLHGAGRCDGILLCAAHRAAAAGDAAALTEIAELAAAFVPSRERHLETTAQGRAFVETVGAAWPCPALDLLAPGDIAYPVAVGVAAAGHRLPLEAMLHAFLHAQVSNWISAGVRLIPLGQTDSQRLIAALEPAVRACAARALQATPDDLGSATFRADLASMRHETQYTRLFRS